VSAEPENGWWWNPTESGRGYFIETTSGLHYSDNTRLRRERMPARSKSRLRTTSTERSSGRAARSRSSVRFSGSTKKYRSLLGCSDWSIGRSSPRPAGGGMNGRRPRQRVRYAVREDSADLLRARRRLRKTRHRYELVQAVLQWCAAVAGHGRRSRQSDL